MAGPRIVQLVGIGDTGREFVEFSLATHPRQVRYCSLEQQARLAVPSPLAHRMAVAPNDALEGRRRAGSLERQLGTALANVDVCVLIGRCDRPFESVVLPRAAACAEQLGCLVVAAPLLPFWGEPFGSWRRAAAAMRTTARHADYLHPFPLSRIDLWSKRGDRSDNGLPESERPILTLFESLDPLITEALRPEPHSLINKQRGDALQAKLACLRAIPLDMGGASGFRLPLLTNDALTQHYLIREMDERVIVLNNSAHISLAAAIEIEREVDAAFASNKVSSAAVSARTEDSPTLLLFATGPLPARLLRLFGDPGIPDNQIGTEPSGWRAVTQAREPRTSRATWERRKTEGSPTRQQTNSPRTLPGINGENVLDLGAFATPAPTVITTSFRIAPSAYPELAWIPITWSAGSFRKASPWFAGIRSSGGHATRRQAVREMEIAPGSMAARLDGMASSIETTTIAIGRWLRRLPRSLRQEGAGAIFRQLEERIRRGASVVRSRRLRFEPLALFVPALLLVTPLILATLGVSTLASMSHALRLAKAESPEVVTKFQELDNARILAASSQAPITRKPFDQLGLSGTARTALASHLDLLAVKASFFGLETIGSGSPPFRVVDMNDTRATGRLGLLIQSLAPRTDSRAVALNALGFFPTPDELARASGNTVTVSGAASDLNTLFQDAEGGLDHDDWVAGCGTVLQALRSRFQAKKGAPDEIDLPDRSYILYLGLSGTGDCSERRAKAEATYDALSGYSEVSIRRAVIANDALGQPSRARFSVVLPQTIRADIEADEATKPSTALELYASGMRHFYLLEFDAAQRWFGALAKQQDNIAAALGSYLAARTSFWKAAFSTGGYRPDLYPLSSMSGEDAGPSTAADLESSGPGLARCRKGEEQPESCVRQTFDRPADSAASTVAEPILVAQARAALKRMPIIRPSLLEKYDGSGEDAEDDGGEP